jgi:hypothetical protein
LDESRFTGHARAVDGNAAMADGHGRDGPTPIRRIAVAEPPPVYIVTTGESPERFRGRLAGIEGARLIRALPPRRVVVALRSHADEARLAELPGVEAVILDRLQQPHGRPPGGATAP